MSQIGDKLNFGLAAEVARTEGFKVVCLTLSLFGSDFLNVIFDSRLSW